MDQSNKLVLPHPLCPPPKETTPLPSYVDDQHVYMCNYKVHARAIVDIETMLVADCYAYG